MYSAESHHSNTERQSKKATLFKLARLHGNDNRLQPD